MTRKMKRTLSLLLALVMLCSTMGIMAFAAEKSSPILMQCPSEKCNYAPRVYLLQTFEGLNRVIACPLHNELHDAEEWYTSYIYVCDACGHLYDIDIDPDISYVCLL